MRRPGAGCRKNSLLRHGKEQLDLPQDDNKNICLRIKLLRVLCLGLFHLMGYTGDICRRLIMLCVTVCRLCRNMRGQNGCRLIVVG